MASLRQSRSTLSGRPNRDAPRQPAGLPFPAAMKLPPFFEEDRLAVDAALERLLPAETAPPSSIHTAMRYSVFAGGKRIRPILCLETSRIFASVVLPTLHPACAIELIHTYSLIHDDLPALDNDDLRRGRPTCHKKFGEAVAILAGDGLLTLAFEALAGAPVPPAERVALIQEVASAAGTRDGMVGGQVADLEAEGKEVKPRMPVKDRPHLAKKRLDVLLVERGLVESRQKAQAIILAGEVRVNGQRAEKTGATFPVDAQVEIAGKGSPFASRAGDKLDGALQDFGVSPSNRICLDAGSSAGGFTDCLVQHGATKVYAVDVTIG